jgi:hypothetical protein
VIFPTGIFCLFRTIKNNYNFPKGFPYIVIVNYKRGEGIMFVYVPLLLLSLLFSAFGNQYSTTKKLELDGESLTSIRIDCGSGFLKVYGNKQQNKIEVEAEILVENADKAEIENFLERGLILRLERKGKKAYLQSQVDQSFWESVFGNRPNAIVNLTVTVSSKINLDVDDGSGLILIENIDGDVWLDDGSGETTIRKVTGDLSIDDGSGELIISDIGGNLDIDDGSGEISINRIGGNVTVDDGSGSIRIDDVKKDVTILDDGSGSVSITNVKGKVVRRDD